MKQIKLIVLTQYNYHKNKSQISIAWYTSLNRCNLVSIMMIIKIITHFESTVHVS